MTTSTAKSHPPPKAVRAWVQDHYLYVELDDLRRIGVPLRVYPKLRCAEPEHVANIQIRRAGQALRWEALDEDIQVLDMIGGKFPRKGGQAA